MIEQKTLDTLIGSMVGRYRLEQFIEESYHSPLFLAQAQEISTKYLIRLLPEPTNLMGRNREEYLASFQYKAGQLAALQHPYLMPIVDYGVFRGIPYLVFPHISMRSLRTRLDKNGPMDVLIAGRYLDQICTALEYAHQHGVIHEGLSIDCISLKLDGQILVTNLGLVNLLEPYHENRQMSLRYLSGEGSAPEQLLGRPIGSFTDVYALGAVLYHMLTGSPVFSDNTPEEIAQHHLYASIPPLSQWRSDLPAGLYTIFARAMAKNPAQRFYQPGALANAYHRIVDPNNRTRVPFVMSSSSAVSPREADPSPSKVRITELPKNDYGLVEPTRAERSQPVTMQTPFPAIPASFNDVALSKQSEEQGIRLQRLLGRRRIPTATRTTTLIIATLLVVLIVSSIGVALLTHQGAAGVSLSGQVTFFDNQNRLPWTTDSLSIDVQGLQAPQAGYHYDAWLINNDTEQVIALGEMTENNQRFTLHYIKGGSNGHAGANLLSPGDKIEITLEQGTPKQPVGTVLLSGSFPLKSFAHITHLLIGFPETPQRVGMLMGLLEQTRLLNVQANVLQGLAIRKDAEQTRCVAQNMINIIEGVHGSNYQPLAATCSLQLIVAGDGFGLLGEGFLAGTAEHATLAISQPDATSAMRQHAVLMEIAVANVKSWVTTIDQDALHLRNNSTDLSQVDEMIQFADNAYHGVDINGDGLVDPVTGEAGALTAFQQGQLMASLSLLPSA